MYKRNYAVIKPLVFCFKEKWPRQKILSWPIFCSYICWIYISVCTFVYHESACTRLQICMITFSLLFWGLTMNTSLYFSLILRLNKTDCSNLNISLWEVSIPLILNYLIGFQTGFADWYMYEYMYCWEWLSCCLTVWLSVFDDIVFKYDFLAFYSFYFRLHLEVKVSINVLHLF